MSDFIAPIARIRPGLDMKYHAAVAEDEAARLSDSLLPKAGGKELFFVVVILTGR